MSDTKLPNPIPAGTVVFVPDKNGLHAMRYGGMYKLAHPECTTLQRYTRHPLTTPVHNLSDEMVEAVRNYFHERDNGAVMQHHIDALRAAFAHVLTPPVVEKPVKCADVVSVLRATNPSHVNASIDHLSDALDAVIARLGKAGI